MKAIFIDDNIIKVQGKVQDDIIRNVLKQNLAADEAAGWFFIDYSSSDYPLQSKFDLLFSKDDMVKVLADITLEAVLDSFGNRFEDGIPKGFKTAVKLVFSGEIPPQLQGLPVLKGWHPTPNEIWLSSIQNIKLSYSTQIFGDFYKLILFDLQKDGSDLQQITKEKFLNYFKVKKIKDSQNVLNFFIRQGFIKETNENVLNFQMVE